MLLTMGFGPVQWRGEASSGGAAGPRALAGRPLGRWMDLAIDRVSEAGRVNARRCWSWAMRKAEEGSTQTRARAELGAGRRPCVLARQKQGTAPEMRSRAADESCRGSLWLVPVGPDDDG